jgi:protein TonB
LAAEGEPGLVIPADSLAAAPDSSAVVVDPLPGGKQGAVVDSVQDARELKNLDRPEDAADSPASDPATRDPAAVDTLVYEQVDSEPVAFGSEEALKNLFRYPDEAEQAGVAGVVKVSFVVDERGRVVDPQVVQSVGAGCDQEAERVARLTRYRPAILDGSPVRFRMTTQFECSPAPEP